MNSTKKKLPTIVVAYFSNPEHCSPTLDAICSMSNNYKVIAITRNAGQYYFKYPENVALYKIGPGVDLINHPLSICEKIIEYISFIFKIHFELKKEKASLLFCYDTPAFIAGYIAKIFLPKIPVFYHQNETVLFSEIPKSSPLYWAKYLEVVFIRFVESLSFPESNRAKYFLKDIKLKKDVIIVENCPRKFAQIPECAQKMYELKMKGYRIILHRGPIGKGDSIDIHETIRSVKYWIPNTIFVNIGIYTKEEEKLCMQIALEEGLENRIMFIPFIADQEEMFKHIACADVGLVLYKPIQINSKYVAPCKLYDYFACGVPVIVPKSLPYISEMVNRLGVGLSYEESTPESIGKTVRELLEHPDRELMARRARAEHLSRLNFEAQFQPVMDNIKNFINKNNG